MLSAFWTMGRRLAPCYASLVKGQAGVAADWGPYVSGANIIGLDQVKFTITSDEFSSAGLNIPGADQPHGWIAGPTPWGLALVDGVPGVGSLIPCRGRIISATEVGLYADRDLTAVTTVRWVAGYGLSREANISNQIITDTRSDDLNPGYVGNPLLFGTGTAT